MLFANDDIAKKVFTYICATLHLLGMQKPAEMERI